MKYVAFAAALAASPALAGVDEAVNDYLLPHLSEFTQSANALNDVAQTNCTAEALKGPYNATFDAWTAISDFRLGPSEHGALSLSFWPDTRGFTDKSLSELIADEDPVVKDQAAFEEISIAARGFFALERVLYDGEMSAYGEGDYTCALARALTHDIADQAVALEAAWADFAPLLLAPGAEGNTTYLDESESQRAIYTQILSSLEWTQDTRLGRPLGEVDRPRPTRAEAWRSGRSLTQAVLAAEAAVGLAQSLADWELPQTTAALAEVQEQAASIDDGSFQNIDDLMKRLNVEILQQKIDAVENAVEVEVGTRFGITPGFNSSDGD
ncbi:MAG: imelysin family protein [Pseudomonadota bacterium]|nr:imelysin family protein [Pseudomonadota bacterium]